MGRTDHLVELNMLVRAADDCFGPVCVLGLFCEFIWNDIRNFLYVIIEGTTTVQNQYAWRDTPDTMNTTQLTMCS